MDAAGRVVIGHWASFAWRGLGFSWQSVVLCEPEGPPRRRTSLARDPAPVRRDGAIEWNSPALECSIHAEPLLDSVALRLLDAPGGTVDWTCEAPAARVSVELARHPPIRGPGYAERLSMTIPPWRLPIRELRWGRWHDAEGARSIVWIDWRGPAPRTWVIADGRSVPDATVTDSGLSAGGLSLTLSGSRDLEARALDDVLRSIPPLQSMLPKALLALRERRWKSSGTLRSGATAPVTGEAIHELVVMA